MEKARLIAGEKVIKIVSGFYTTSDGLSFRQGSNDNGNPAGGWSVFDDAVCDWEAIYETDTTSITEAIKRFRKQQAQ
jgi:hypothetical protein